MTNVLLIDPSYRVPGYFQVKDIYPHTGILLMGTILKQNGHKVKVVHMLSDGVTLQSLSPLVKDFKPDIVGITMVTFQLGYAYEVAKVIKNVSRNILIVVGGAHPSATPLSTHTRLPFNECVDMEIQGEGEYPIVELARHGDVFPNRPVQDLDSLPFINLSLTDIKRFIGIYPPGHMPSMPLMFSRGCPFHCGFCSKSVFGDKVRFRSVELVVEEIKQMNEKDGIKEIFFQDDTFNTNLEYCHKLIDGLLSAGLNKKMWFRARLRANEKLITKELLSKMNKARFWSIFYGVENGNQEMLDRSIGKQLRIEEIKRAFKMTREAGIKTEASLIIGMPGETSRTIQDSLNLYHEIQPDWCTFNAAIPFPGTPFEKEARKKGQLLYENYEDYTLTGTFVRTDALTAHELAVWGCKASEMMTRDRLKHPKVLFGVVSDIVRNPSYAVKRAIALMKRGQ
jgi:radical SAM superfamily enzyme YgiQ (UPF0313 family)